MYQKAPERKRLQPLRSCARNFRQAVHDAATQHRQELPLQLGAARGPAAHGKMAADRLSTLQLADARARDANHVLAGDGRKLGHVEARLERTLPCPTPVGAARLSLDD